MRVLAACSLGGAGHLQPLLPFLDAARASGHETRVIGPPTISPMVREATHPFTAGGEPPESSVAPIREQLPVASRAEAARLGNRELFGRLATTAMRPAMERVLGEWKPDIVLRDPCEYASAVVAHGMGIRAAQIAIGLAVVEWESIRIAAPALEAHQAGLADVIRTSPYVTRFPASLDLSPFTDTRRVQERVDAHPAELPDWWDSSNAPLVYMSFGTVLGHMTIAEGVYRLALRAAGLIGARVLLTVGRRFDPARLAPFPPNVHVEQWVDQGTVLRHADAVVSHGGSGTTLAALRAGIPVVVVPLFADQHANAAMVVEAGVGIALDPARGGGGRPLDEDVAGHLAAAVEAVRTRPSYRDAVRRVAAEMSAAPSVSAQLAALLADR